MNRPGKLGIFRRNAAWGIRSIYMRSNKKARKNIDIQRQLEEKRQLDESIKQIQAYTSALRKHMWQQKDKENQKKVARSEGIGALDGVYEDAEVEKFAQLVEESDREKGEQLSGKGLFEQKMSLPEPILNRIGDTNAVVLLASEEPNWGNVVKALYDHEKGLSGLQVTDVDQLIEMIPLNQRAELMPIVHEMMFDSNLTPSKMTLDLTMAAYADRGSVEVVESFMEELRERGFKPDDYSYGHLIKAYSKKYDLKSCVRILKQMQSEGIEQPSNKVTTNLLQTCIKVGDFKQTEEIFSMMKYLSATTQPDIRVYNSMLLAASKQHNVDRVLDLYNEMTTRPIDPLEPNMETLLTLIYACARDRRTHLKAWQYVLEVQERKLPVTRKLINTLMYLCGNTGELSFARALFKQLCANESTYPDSFTLNCLFKAYENFKPGYFSPVLTTVLGNQIRSAFLVNNAETKNGYDPTTMPPFLTISMLRDGQQVMWESRAIFAFFKDNRPDILNDKIILNYLAIPAYLGQTEEFERRFWEHTYLEDKESGQVLSTDKSKMARNHYVYDLAIKACSIGSGDNLAFASEVWTDRGKWRKTDSFQNLTKSQRHNSDFLFARGMISTFSQCGEVNDAIDILKSCINQFPWKHHHVEPLLAKLTELDDSENLSLVRRMIKQKWADQYDRVSEYVKHKGDEDYAKMSRR